MIELLKHISAKSFIFLQVCLFVCLSVFVIKFKHSNICRNKYLGGKEAEEREGGNI